MVHSVHDVLWFHQTSSDREHIGNIWRNVEIFSPSDVVLRVFNLKFLRYFLDNLIDHIVHIISDRIVDDL